MNIESTAKSAAANEIARQLQEAGLRVTVERLPWEEYTAALAARDFDLYLGEVYLTPDFDLSALIAPGGALNYGGWEDDVISGLLSAFRTAEGEAVRRLLSVPLSLPAGAHCAHLLQKRLGPHPVRAAGPAEPDPVQRLL